MAALPERALAALQHAIGLHNEGRLDEADAIYRKFLREAPGHPDALHLRALVAHARGAFADAARFADAAIAQAPRIANFHNTAGEAWRRQGETARALKRLQEAVRLDPAMAMAQQNLALVLCELGQLDEALARCQRALELQPASPEARIAQLEILGRKGDFGDDASRQARALVAQGSPVAQEAAAAFFARAARAQLQRLDFGAARTLAGEACAAAPRFWAGWAVLAEAENELGEVGAAELHGTLAANLAPANEDARVNLAHLLKEQHRLEEAESHYRGWLARQPASPAARFGLAGTLLMRGEYAQAWPLYEARWELPGAARFAAAPPWTGQRAARLLLHAEQGLGDTLQMLRFLPRVRSRSGGAVTLLVQAPLASIVRRAPLAQGIEVVTELAGDRTFDAACGLMSLPGLLGVAAPADAAADGPYLAHDPARAAQFAQRLAAHPGRKLGVVWLGGTAGPTNRRRRLPEAALLPLLTMPGWTPVSLQFGVHAPQVAGQPLVDLSDDIADFDDLAAAMHAVDAIVSLDSGPAHLAGALGLPVSILVPWLHDWRWGRAGDTCPWYPAATLVRQPVGGRWEAPIAALVARLAGREAPPAQEPPRAAAGPIVRNAFPLVQARCRDGLFTLPLLDRYVSLSLLLYGEYSPREAALLASWLRPGDTALDVGANLGALTLAMARAVGTGGRVIAFEPQGAIHECLRQTVADSDVPQVQLQRRAVGATAGGTRIARLDLANPANFGGASVAPKGPGEEVEVVALDDLDLASCRLLKVDVEGHELAVLRGATGLIARCRPVIQVEADRPDSRGPLLDFLRAQGYRVFRHEPPLFDARNHRGCGLDAFPGIVSGNLVALPPGEPPAPDLLPA